MGSVSREEQRDGEDSQASSLRPPSHDASGHLRPTNACLVLQSCAIGAITESSPVVPLGKPRLTNARPGTGSVAGQYQSVAISQLPLLTLLCPSHEKQPSRKDTVSAIYCTVTNSSKTQWLKITNIYYHAVPVGQETRRSLVGSSEGLKVSHKDTVGVPAAVVAISGSTQGGPAFQTHMRDC